MEYTFEELVENIYHKIKHHPEYTDEEYNIRRYSVENALRVLRLPLSEEVGIKLALEELNKV